MRILNTKRHDITRQSPVSLTYLDGQSMEKSLLDTWTPTEQAAMKLPEWIDKMMSAQRTLLRIAQENQLEHDHQILKRTPHFPVDSFVLVAYPQRGCTKVRPTS